MEVEAYKLDSSILWIKLAGRLDFDSVAKWEPAILAKAAMSKAAVIIDLAKVDFLGSSGLRVFLKCARGQRALGGSVRLCAANPFVHEVIAVAGINALVPTHESFEEACDRARAEVGTEDGSPGGSLPAFIPQAPPQVEAPAGLRNREAGVRAV